MKLANTDWKRAGWVGLALLGAAGFIIFGLHPGGFESQIGWFLDLLPGAYIGAILPHPLFESSSFLSDLSFRILSFVLSFLWYFGIAYAVIKVGRFVIRPFTR